MYKEKNTINFYHLNNVEIVEGKSNHSFPMHSHNAFCIGIVKDKIMKLKIHNQEYLLEKNDVYIIPPHTEHTIASVNNIQYEYLVICLYNNNLEKYSDISLRKYVFRDKMTSIAILSMIENWKNNDNICSLETNLFKFLNEYIEIDHNSIKKQINKEIILLAEDFIIDNLNESFDLKKLSDYTNITKYHLVRVFKSQMGITPYQFYIQEKVKEIRKGLLKQQSISDLVFDLNFTDQSHLCNSFKKHMGITPMQFKNSCKII